MTGVSTARCGEKDFNLHCNISQSFEPASLANDMPESICNSVGAETAAKSKSD